MSSIRSFILLYVLLVANNAVANVTCNFVYESMPLRGYVSQLKQTVLSSLSGGDVLTGTRARFFSEIRYCHKPPAKDTTIIKFSASEISKLSQNYVKYNMGNALGSENINITEASISLSSEFTDPLEKSSSPIIIKDHNTKSEDLFNFYTILKLTYLSPCQNRDDYKIARDWLREHTSIFLFNGNPHPSSGNNIIRGTDINTIAEFLGVSFTHESNSNLTIKADVTIKGRANKISSNWTNVTGSNKQICHYPVYVEIKIRKDTLIEMPGNYNLSIGVAF